MYVIAAVHSREARRALQYETPMVLWDAGATEGGECFIWRHILGINDCMWCKHPPGEKDPEEQKAQQFSQLVGLDAEAWLRKVRTNEPFTQEEVAAITEGVLSCANPFDFPAAGQRYGDWEAAQCGRLALPAQPSFRAPAPGNHSWTGQWVLNLRTFPTRQTNTG